MDAAPAAASTGGKAPKPFLRRGEGVEKRVFASRYRKAIIPTASNTANSTDGGGGSESWEPAEHAARHRRGGHQGQHNPAQPDAWAWEDKATELASETQLLSVERPPDEHLESGAIGSRFLRNSVKAAWASRQAEEELELEEFRALETQIKADVVGAARPRSDQSNQALSGNSTLLPSAPVRSYAAIHQHRPPLPNTGAARGANQSGGTAGQARGWGSPQHAGCQRYNDAFGASHGDGEGGDDEGMEEGQSEPNGGNDGALPPAPSWGQQQQQGSPGRSGAPSGGRGFDDTDAWNDNSNFWGPGAGVRKGAAAAAAAGSAAGGKPQSRGSAFFGGHARSSPAAPSPLDDPWAAPVGGEGPYFGTGAEAAPDDCSGWSADQQHKPQAASHKGLEDDRGPDQPFVRALFSKQQRQQPSGGGGRAADKGVSSGGGKAKAAENAGPSPAELERMQALEEQLATAASERATLIKMRTELEKAANRLEQERQAWEKSRAEEQAKWEAQRDAEEAKLRRDRRVLEKQSKALLKLPNKKERTAMEAAEAALEAERREGRAREARHKLTVERLRRQLLDLQERNHELREEVRWHEAQQLERGWGANGTAGSQTASGPGAAAGGGKGGAKPRLTKAMAVQTDPLAFLPPLECLTTGVAGASGQPDTASSHIAFNASASSQFSKPEGSRDDATAPATARPKSSGAPASAGAGPGPGSRLRAMQAGPGRGAGAVGASQPTLPTTWRGERAGVRRSGAPGAMEEWQASAQGAEGDAMLDEDESYNEEAGPAYYGERSSNQQQHLQRQRGARFGLRPDSSVSWQQGGEEGYGGADADGVERGQFDEDDDLEADGGRAAASPSSRSYAQNDDAEVLSDEAGCGDGMDSDNLSALAWQQHQEFMARMGLARQEGPGGMPAGEGLRAPAAEQWQNSQRQQPPQHQRQQPQQQQPQQQQQQQPWGRPGYPRAREEQDHAPRHPDASGSAFQQQRQSQQQGRPPGVPPGTQPFRPANAGQGNTGPAASRPATARPTGTAGASNPAWQSNPQGPGPGAAGQGSPRWRANGAAGPGRNGNGAGAGPGSKDSGSSAFFGSLQDTATGGAPTTAAPRSFPADGRSFETAATAQGRGSAQGPARPSGSLRDSVSDLDGVSQTLAALRMDRHVGAAAAAVATGARAGGHAAAGPTGPGRGPSFGLGQAPGPGLHPSLQRGPAQRQGPGAAAQAGDDGGVDWPAEPWSAAGGSGGPGLGPVRQHETWGPGTADDEGNWVGSSCTSGQAHYFDHQPQPAQAQWQYGVEAAQAPGPQQPPSRNAPGAPHQGQAQAQQLSGGYGPGPGHGYRAQQQGQWTDGMMMGTAAANAASVAQSISTQHHHHHQHRQAAQATTFGGGAASFGSGGQDSRVSGGNGGGGGDVLLREVQHPDGKTERFYSSGTRLVLFANGTRKVALPDGSSRVYFINGDIKWAVPAAAAAAAAARAAAAAASSPHSAPPALPPDVGVVHYYYAEVATWHSTYGGEGGVEVFYFPSGQTEAHHPGHGKEILFPDGVLRVVTVDGEEVDVSWDQLSWAVQQPQPRVEELGDDDL